MVLVFRGFLVVFIMGFCWFGFFIRDLVLLSSFVFVGFIMIVGGGILRGFGLYVCRWVIFRIESVVCGLGYCCLDY